MKKFVVVYRVPVEVMEEWKKNTPPEVMREQGEKLGADMMAGTKKHDMALVDKGLPLGKNTRLTSEGAKAVTNDLNYYQVLEAESIDAAVEMLKDNPHIQVIPEAFLDIMEVPHMGM